MFFLKYRPRFLFKDIVKKVADGPTNDSARNESRSHNSEEAMRRIIEIVAAVICAALSGLFFSTGHQVVGLWTTFLAVFLALLLIVDYVHHNFPSLAKTAKFSFFVLLVALVLGVIVWTRRLLQKIYPNLTVSFSDSDFPAEQLALTNDFLEPVMHFWQIRIGA